MSNGGQPLAVIAVKSIHTAVFVGELMSSAWLVISGLVGRRDRTVALAAAAVAAEATVFCGNDRVCPLTPLTERLGAAHGQVTGIFLPDRVARTIPDLVERSRRARGRAPRSLRVACVARLVIA